MQAKEVTIAVVQIVLNVFFMMNVFYLMKRCVIYSE